MNLNISATMAMGISVIYIAAAFLFNQTLTSFQTTLVWVSSVLTTVNMGILFYAFIRGKTLTRSIIPLNLVQLGLFSVLCMQLPAQTHYIYDSAPVITDWLRFIAAYTLKAADFPDIIEAYNISLHDITLQSTGAKVAVFCTEFMVGMFVLALIFNGIHRILQANPLTMMKWAGICGLAGSLLMMLLAGWKNQWPISNWYLWPADNILRALDFGDLLQIFGINIRATGPGMDSPVTAIFFRVVILGGAIGLIYPFYSRVLEGRRSVEELVKIIRSHEYSTRDRMVAISELESFGPFATSAVPALIKVMITSNKAIRNEAIHALSEIDEEWSRSESARHAIPRLVKMLKSDDIGTRIEAAETLGEFGTAAEDAVPDLVKVFTDSDVIRTAAQTLGKIGSAAIPDLVRVLVNEDEYVRHAAVHALEKIDPEWQQTDAACKQITRFVKALEKNDENERTSAVRALGEIGPAAAPHLAQLLADTDVRRLAINALGEMGPAAEQAAVPHLINVLGNQNKEVRNLAIQALGKIDPQWRESESALNAVPYFMQALREGEEASDDRSAAGEALVEIGKPCIHPLVEALVEGNKDLFNIAVQVLKRIDPRWPQRQGAVKAVPHLSAALQNSQWYVRRTAAEILGKIGPAARESVPHLVKALADSNKKSRAAVKTALDKVLLKNTPYAPEDEEDVSPEARSEITRLINELISGTGESRSKAAEALGEMGPSAEEVIPHLVKALADHDPTLRSEASLALGRINSEWQRHESTLNTIPLFVNALAGADVGFPCGMPREALTEIGPAVSVRYLVEALAHSNRDVVNSAAKFLKKIEPDWPKSEGAQEAVPRLAEALGDSQWFVRKAAAEVIGKIGPGAIKAVPYLVKGLADKNKEVRNACKASLNKVTVKKNEM